MQKGKKVLFKLGGTFVDIMCQINRGNKKNVRYKNGQNFLYMLVLHAMSGCIEFAIQW